MALLARIRSGPAAYALAFLIVGSLAGTVVIALHSATPFNLLGRLLTEPKTADPAESTTPASNTPAPAAMARVNAHLSSLVDSGDLPAFNPFTSIEPAMMFVLNAGGGDASVYQTPESLLPPLGEFDGNSEAPEYQLARVAGISVYGGNSFGGSGGGIAGGGSGITGTSRSGVSDRPEFSASRSDSVPAGPGLTIDRTGGGSSGNGSTGNGSGGNGSSAPSDGAARGTGVPASPTDPLLSLGPRNGMGGSGAPVSVPEPSSLLLTGAGLIGLASAMRRRNGVK